MAGLRGGSFRAVQARAWSDLPYKAVIQAGIFTLRQEGFLQGRHAVQQDGQHLLRGYHRGG